MAHSSDPEADGRGILLWLEQLLSSDQFVVCSGAKPVPLEDSCDQLVTRSDELMDLTELPESTGRSESSATAGVAADIHFGDLSERGCVRKGCGQCAWHKMFTDGSAGKIVGAQLPGAEAAELIHDFAAINAEDSRGGADGFPNVHL